jgi:hypothetical protein
MAEALEERASCEIIDRDMVIEGLQKECDDLAVAKGRLEEEVKGL